MNKLPFLRNFDITKLLVRAVIVLIAISVHEAAHGLAAYLLGDRQQKAMGRMSMNPLRHLDPMGALCLLLFGFGWAKPVMVNSYSFKNPKAGMSIVGLAGPLSNFILALLGLLGLRIVFETNLFQNEFLVQSVSTLVGINVGLGVFNLIPIPPLDGSKIFLSLLPNRIYYDIMKYEQIGWILLVCALALGVLDPILNTCGNAVIRFLSFLVGM